MCQDLLAAQDPVPRRNMWWCAPASCCDRCLTTHLLCAEVGGIALVLIYGAALVASVANPLTKRRLEAGEGTLFCRV